MHEIAETTGAFPLADGTPRFWSSARRIATQLGKGPIPSCGVNRGSRAPPACELGRLWQLKVDECIRPGRAAQANQMAAER